MKKLTLIVFLISFCSIAFSQSNENTFNNGSNNGYWNDNGNWSLGHVPNTFQVAVIPDGLTCTLRAGQTAIVNDVKVETGGILNVNGELTLLESGTVITDVVGQADNKIWMDRNLGADVVGAHGDHYQWGRLTDRHEKHLSGTTSVLSTSDIPGHGDFIRTPGGDPDNPSQPNDWLNQKNDNLWQGVNGDNNPCPSGYRLPTQAEWLAESAFWGSNPAAGAWNGPLSLVLNGARDCVDGGYLDGNWTGYYWASTVDGYKAVFLYLNDSYLDVTYQWRAFGFGVRCIKD